MFLVLSPVSKRLLSEKEVCEFMLHFLNSFLGQNSRSWHSNDKFADPVTWTQISAGAVLYWVPALEHISQVCRASEALSLELPSAGVSACTPQLWLQPGCCAQCQTCLHHQCRPSDLPVDLCLVAWLCVPGKDISNRGLDKFCLLY